MTVPGAQLRGRAPIPGNGSGRWVTALRDKQERCVRVCVRACAAGGSRSSHRVSVVCEVSDVTQRSHGTAGAAAAAQLSRCHVRVRVWVRRWVA